ncbi:M50 family metallopeptidase [Mycolicibacterium sp. BiH015]|uniref:M50 family metallopeptidase n=1 Tax=Mycolicibacterium sp. BiH015 TaxID=3018808 RepID=UPI0022E0E7E0|nr:M50 family metallopeptidase [Mycolicibacterium sp. BiH015]MDA2894839.1 M50 family metallopeptidase [Mycolicibacterium sp. BiH015]
MTTMGAEPTQVVLRRAEGVELMGEMVGSGYRVPPSLARRGDGQTVQLTPLLYAVLHEIDGEKTAAEVASAVSESTGRGISEDNVSQLIDEKLRPLGLLTLSDGSQPAVRKRDPLLGLRFRYAVTDPERTNGLTDPFRILFRPWVTIPALAAFAVVCWWVFFEKGLASAAHDAFERPGLLILVFAVTIVSAGFHEFGHAAAARYGGATPGVMGFGVYLVWPAFYTDVTDSYRLGRWGRIRTDLGGLYFNALVAVAITGLWLWLGYDALLLVVATQILQMLRQLAPLVRFDGYHVLADVTGVPDLYSRIKPTLLGALPWRWGDPHARLLKPWARIVVTLWVILVVPLLLATLAIAVWALPRVLGSAWAGLQKQQDVLSTAWGDGDVIQMVARVLAMIAIVIPVAGVLYMLARLVRRSTAGVWKSTADKPLMRMVAVAAGMAIGCGVAYAWWPGEANYRPIQPWERGTIGDIVYALDVGRLSNPAGGGADPRPVASSRTLVNGQQGVMQAVWDTSSAMPTKQSPQLALVLTPKTGPEMRGGSGVGSTATAPQGWVFPVDKPLAPEPGDVQALAINTTDGTAEYEAAFAMVWVTDDSDAMNVNEAQAYASCNSCAAVAIAYQVLFVVDNDDTDDNVVAPQNLAGALNYECVNCLTYALARQVFVTLDEPLSEDAMRQLDKVWSEMKMFQLQIELGLVRPEDIETRLGEYTEQILGIVAAEQPEAVASQTESSTAPTTTTSGVPTTTSSPTSTVATTSAPTSAPTTSAESSVPTTSGASTVVAEPTQTATSAPPAPEETATTDSGTSTDTTVDNTADTGTTSDGAASTGSTESP